MGGKNPQGIEINANSHYLTLGGKPWMPVMGEFHYCRCPADEWEDELIKMKAGGVTVVSTYCIWIYHEEQQGQFDWSGNRDIRRFVQLCAKHGLYVYARIGPWCHGEVRNGGFPDWLPESFKRTRRDDASLSHVREWYTALAKQFDGLLFKDGGPVIGIQLDNETGNQPAYLGSLKKLAVEVGFDVPLYSYTGWNRSRGPADEMIPFYGGYPDGFWLTDRGISHSGRRQYIFTHILDDANITEHLTGRPGSLTLNGESRYPYLTCEIGDGMAISYARRVTLSTDDIATLPLVKIGSGANAPGYYMYHGGSDAIGKLTTLQESQATGYPNDLPIINYDFQAPLGQFGQVRDSFHALRLLHMFINDFGAALAPMGSFFPTAMPSSLDDAQTLRWAARSDGRSGFIFMNNYQRGTKMEDHHGVQFSLKLADGMQTVPGKLMDIPADAYGIIPFNLDLNGTLLKSSTAQLLCKLDGSVPTFVFFAIPGIEPRFEFDSPQNVATNSAPAIFDLRAKDGRRAHIMLLTREEALACVKANLWGRDRLLVARANLFVDGKSIRLESDDPKYLSIMMFPPPPRWPTVARTSPQVSSDGSTATYAAFQSVKQVDVEVQQIQAVGPVREMKMGTRKKPLPPEDSDFQNAGVWHISVPKDALAGVADVLLRVDYTGDVARAYIGDQLIDDDFYSGHPWEIGLKHFAPEVLEKGITLKILPMPEKSAIFVQENAPPAGEVKLIGVEPKVVYQLTLQCGE
jgi:hypothetical protein